VEGEFGAIVDVVAANTDVFAEEEGDVSSGVMDAEYV